ncbi:MAG: type II secretion system major pseudopilin GspG [Proteobacteria bacterium]|nr:type II secretion system major pseudopilin GspG [Pseudomonadota bacterium]
MVVVVIIGILASVVVPRIMDNPDKARVAKAKNDIRALESALDIYRLDNYTYPTTDQGLEALISRPTGTPEPANWKQGGYVKKLNKDPWGNEYLYLNPGEHGETDIYSLGADGAPGGEGPYKDIGSWDQD